MDRFAAPAEEVGNLPSKFGHARPLGFRIIRYVRDGQTDGRMDKSNAYCPFPTFGGIIRIGPNTNNGFV